MKRAAAVSTLILFLCIPSFFAIADAAASQDELLERAKQILADAPLIDGHNDVPWAYKEHAENRLDAIDLASDTTMIEHPMHTDIPRLREGRVGAQFWSVYVPTSYSSVDAVSQVFEQIDFVHRMTAKYSDTFEMAYTAADIERIHKAGRIASLIGMEGGHSIGDSLAVLRQTYTAGARYMTLTHSDHTNWADSSTKEPKHDGLTEFGRELVREMNRLGMLVDLSHVSEKSMNDVLDVVEAPVIFSHSSARALASHPRNVPDKVLARMPDNGGVVMVTFVPAFLSDASWESYAKKSGAKKMFEILHPDDPKKAEKALEQWSTENPPATVSLSDVADHIDHIRKIAGIDHIGIGSDFDGISTTPVNLTGVQDFPLLFAELLRRGYSDDDLKKIAGQNVLRVMKKVEETSAKLRSAHRASESRIDDTAE